MKKMKIEVWSDIACPYCYIGKRKLEAALDLFPHKDNVELVWHSYELSPDLPKTALSQPYYSYFAENFKMTGQEAIDTNAKVARLAKEVGLDYNFDKLVVANTSDALRLVKLAKEFDLATEAEEVLFDAYFITGKDISDRTTLIALGTKIGLSEQAIVQMLDSDRFVADIKADMQYSEQELKLEYIPFYLFNGKHVVQGSIPSEDYLSILVKSYSEWEKDGVSTKVEDMISGQSCSIDGVCT